MGRDESDCAKMRRIEISILPLLILLLVPSERRVHPGGGRGVAVVDAQMEMQFQKCCGLGTTWATEGLRCEKFTGPVPGVPRVEQGLCLEAVDICCVRAYHDQQCKKGKADARAGLACVKNSPLASKTPGRGDYHRDCCEGCKLGILTGSMGQGCAFKTFSFGVPWDPAFLECCYESSSTTGMPTDFTNATWSTDPTNNTQSSSLSSSTFSSSSFSPSSSTSSMSSPLSSLSSPSSSSSSSPSSSSTSNTSPSDASSPTSYSPSIPTPKLDDICQLMKGLLCSDICIPTPGSYRCACREGFTLLEDEKTCRQDLPSDRCKGPNPCEQRCTDTGSAVICSCNPGYILADDKRSCTPQSTKQTQKTPKDQDEYSALCPSGYRYNASAEVCNDVDECLEENLCSGNCVNTIGSYLCLTSDAGATGAVYTTCPPGYLWDVRLATCTDIDECAASPSPCKDDREFCVNIQGSFTCMQMKSARNCPAGFKFDNLTQACKDVDECAEDIHGCQRETEECRNTEGAYECDVKCERGYTFSIVMGSCVDINECIETSRPCPEPKARCVNTMGSYECVSSFDRRPASSVPTQQSNSSNCPAGFKVTNNPPRACTDVDECAEGLHACDENEDCANEIGSYRCEPSEKSEDASRRVAQEEAEDRQEQEEDDYNRQKVYRWDNGRTFTSASTTSATVHERQRENCESGYSYDARFQRCIDINECLTGPAVCGIGERCINTDGGYRCSPTCPPGFRPRSRYHVNAIEEECEDIDECRLGLHTCNTAIYACINTNGSYVCELLTTTTTTNAATAATTSRPYSDSRFKKDQSADRYWSLEPCRLGYRKDPSTGRCVDVDECTAGPGCREDEICQNTPGGYDCSSRCSSGWVFNPAMRGCQDVDECLLGRHDCPQDTHQCVNTNGSFTCEVILPCRYGFKRAFNGSCVDVDECSDNTHNCRLEMHQYCVNKEGSFECLTRLPPCSPGYQYSLTTRRCEDIDECSSSRHTCDPRFAERCVNLPGTFRCERPSSPQRQRQRPACPSGYRYHPQLRQCTDIDECEEELDTCGDEVCYNQPGGYSCARAPKPIPRRPPTSPLPASTDQKCVDGTRFVRNRGCVDVDECREVEDACSSNEECINTMGSYTCNCKPGFRRDNLTQACVDINECQLKNDCLPTQRCDNTIGSYSCTRFLPCGTGYTLNAATEICEDDDECILGSHDCGEGYHCRNTLGSYRCDRNPRGQQYQTRPYPPMETVTSPSSTSEAPTTEALTSLPRIECPRGFEPGSGGQCIDIDECRRQQSPCGRTQRCLNTMGSYRCVSRVICGNGFTFDSATGRCIDVDECSDGSQQCTPDQTCQNRIGGYVCVCPHGFAEGPNKDCVDIDECSVYGSNICGEHSRCENTPGSYRCICEEGFENVKGAPDGVCQDTDECKKIPGLCQHVCLNLWGSHRCGCELGYRLNADNRSCTDVDECSEYKDHNLCIGICENTPGSYACKCPDGYKLGADGRTCQDIDECAAGPVCRGRDEMCQNMRGTFRCNRINCPAGYHRDMDRKNRCVRSSRFCPSNDMACFRMPSHYSYNFITFVSMLPLPSTGQQELFTMRGTHLPGSIMQFSMALVDARAPPGVARATESCFALRKPGPTQAVLVLTRSIPGPQEIELDLSMEIYRNADFVGSAVAKLLIFVSQYEF